MAYVPFRCPEIARVLGLDLAMAAPADRDAMLYLFAGHIEKHLREAAPGLTDAQLQDAIVSLSIEIGEAALEVIRLSDGHAGHA